MLIFISIRSGENSTSVDVLYMYNLHTQQQSSLWLILIKTFNIINSFWFIRTNIPTNQMIEQNAARYSTPTIIIIEKYSSLRPRFLAIFCFFCLPFSTKNASFFQIKSSFSEFIVAHYKAHATVQTVFAFYQFARRQKYDSKTDENQLQNCITSSTKRMC